MTESRLAALDFFLSETKPDIMCLNETEPFSWNKMLVHWFKKGNYKKWVIKNRPHKGPVDVNEGSFIGK